MYKLKLFLFLLLIVGLCVGTQAQTKMVLHQKSGGDVSYAFNEKPKLTYKGAYLHVTTTSVSIDYPLSQLLKLTFENVTTSVDVLTDTTESRGAIDVYSLGGTLVKKITAAVGTASLDINDLPSGTYIVNNGTTTYKIIKR